MTGLDALAPPWRSAVIVVMPVMIVSARTVTVTVTVIMMDVTSPGIGAAFGIEGRFDGADLAAEAVDHLLDHMIAANAQALCP